MKLVDLKPQFLRWEIHTELVSKVDPAFHWDTERKQYLNAEGAEWRAVGAPTIDVVADREHGVNVDSLAQAQGVMFLCPNCFKANNGEEGTHHCIIPFEGRGLDPKLHPHQWKVSGSYYDDLSTTPSYLIVGACSLHCYITNGEIVIV